MHPNEITGQIVDAAMRVHTALGPGLLESTYEACLIHELHERGFQVQSQVPVPVVYGGVRVAVGYRIDVLVNGAVVVEIKAVDAIHPAHRAQLLSYLRLTGLKVGLLLNFNEVHLKNGIVRMANGI